MAKYTFRLQTLRRLREIARDERRSQLAAAFEAERLLAEQRTALAAEETAEAAVQRTVVQQSPVDVNRLLASQRYQLALQSQGRLLAEQSEKLAVEVERRRAAVIEAEREVRVLDKLDERQRAAHQKTERLAEMKRLDEIGSVRWKEAAR